VCEKESERERWKSDREVMSKANRKRKITMSKKVEVQMKRPALYTTHKTVMRENTK